MFTGIHFIPADTKIGFVRLRTISWVISALLTVVPLLLVWKVGLNFGIDFQGGTLIEIQTKESVADLADIRAKVHGLNLGEVQIQEFGAPNDVLIRVAAQPTEKEQQESIAKVKQVLGDQVEYRRIEVVGPTISSELIAGGTVAVVIAMTKGDLLKATLQGDPVKYWPHWTAVIQETKTGQRFAVDSWIYANGENPAVVEVEKWYIKDIDNLPKATN